MKHLKPKKRVTTEVQKVSTSSHVDDCSSCVDTPTSSFVDSDVSPLTKSNPKSKITKKSKSRSPKKANKQSTTYSATEKAAETSSFVNTT